MSTAGTSTESSNQEKVDAFFGISAQSRAEMSHGQLPSELRQRLQASSFSKGKGFLLAAGALLVLFLLAVGGRTAILGDGVGVALLLLVVMHEVRLRRRQTRSLASLGPIEATEGHAQTVRYWFPTYGEVSGLRADLLVDNRRYVLPSSFADHVIVGPVRVYWQRPPPSEQATPGLIPYGLELLPGSVLSKRAPSRQPPQNFLEVQPADEVER
ncbi:MAG TPA: hypothetical protein VER96_08390 [Polyangiaceae bacterium]|nr:hypothetical protein [Polyangiaceae bacterium]